jgi:adenylate cyclase
VRGTPSDIERRLWLPYAFWMILSNLVGAVVVLALVLWVVPLPAVDDAAHVQAVNVTAFVVFLAVAVPLGTFAVLRLLQPIRMWLRSDREPTATEQRAVLLAPAREMLIHAALWTAGAALFAGLNLTYGGRLALIVLITVTLGGAATCAIAYLLSQALLRPVNERVLGHEAPERPPLPGVVARMVMPWALGTGVPVVGFTLVGLGQLTGVLDASAHRLAISAVVLGGIALIVGFQVMVLAAQGISHPLRQLRRALARVQRGETDVAVRIYDGSELGLLQAGFNRMVDGLRERERLRDLFGRQVGEDVARQALERGITLGGEEREVAVLFVDLVGSTELAHRSAPAEVVDLLNDFFCVVVEVVAEHGGTINKFVGDAALCVFGAPLEQEDAAGAALAAARALRARLAEEVPRVDVGIGVSAGTAVAGNVGAAERFEYTVIGDPVNEASRLTELAKRHDGRVLASRAAVDAAVDGERERWTDCGEEMLRGRDVPTLLAAPTRPAGG